MTSIEVVEGDILEFTADIVVFKYAQNFYGADGVAARRLIDADVVSEKQLSPEPGAYVQIDTSGNLASNRALFVGVVPLQFFDYGEIRSFVTRALELISRELAQDSHVAMTIHGVGFGLDESESFLAQVGGIFDFKHANISRITIVEANALRAKRLQDLLESSTIEEKSLAPASEPSARINAGITSKTKKHVFVAMPFAEEFEDTFVFGIQNPIHSAGLLCERVDFTVFTGDILQRVKSRIESAALVVADLTGSNANVFLEVGYAWGCNRQTLLLSHESHELPFDVRGQRCIKYKNIVDLSKRLTEDLTVLELA